MPFRPFLRICALLCLLALLAMCLPRAASAQLSLDRSRHAVQTPHVRAELLVHAPEGVQPGKPLWLGLLLEHQPHWHSYWKNPGDSGLPTELFWQLPAGLQAGEIAWPVPQALPIAPLLNYGYEGRVLLPVPVTVAEDFQPPASGTLTLDLHATWLVCRVECIPEEGDLRLQLAAHGSTAGHGAEFARAWAAQPQPLPGTSVARVLPADASARERVRLRVEGLPQTIRGQRLAWYPELPQTFVHAATADAQWPQTWEGDTWVAEVPLSDMRAPAPEAFGLVLTLASGMTDPAQPPGPDPAQPPRAWRSVAEVQGRWSQAPPAGGVPPALAAALEADAAQAFQNTPRNTLRSATGVAPWRWALSLLGGFLGGLLLNLMPCVFPVLAIKVLGFARHGQNRRAQHLAAAAYTAGVLLSFLALGGALLALRAAGEQLGWGFQLQSPAVVATLAALFALLGLNLAGLFEFGSLLPARWAAAQARHPVLDAGLSGVLAVAVASPCTGPFMGAALGLAIDMPPLQALAVFAALGLGMTTPYVLAALMPAFLRCLPRPGAWMQTFRQAMAFPMFATVIWLVWVLGQQNGVHGAAALLAVLLALAALVWAMNLSGRSRSMLVPATALLLLGLLYATAPHLSAGGQASTMANGAPDVTPDATAVGQERWQPWSPARSAQLQAEGRAVFVDFTAAWCITCQINKRTLQHPQVQAAFDQRKVALLRADWTRRNPHITAALRQLGRSGVPAYVLHVPGQPPQVLGELLSRQEVLSALRALGPDA